MEERCGCEGLLLSQHFFDDFQLPLNLSTPHQKVNQLLLRSRRLLLLLWWLFAATADCLRSFHLLINKLYSDTKLYQSAAPAPGKTTISYWVNLGPLTNLDSWSLPSHFSPLYPPSNQPSQLDKSRLNPRILPGTNFQPLQPILIRKFPPLSRRDFPLLL